MKLKIAAKVDNADKEYYDSEIKPLIHGNPDVEFIGEINDAQKPEFLSGAHALLFPIDWPEPFGLVMIEAMACGTPVIAFNCGSVPEVIDDGVTGFIVNDIEEAAAAVGQARRARPRHGARQRSTAASPRGGWPRTTSTSTSASSAGAPPAAPSTPERRQDRPPVVGTAGPDLACNLPQHPDRQPPDRITGNWRGCLPSSTASGRMLAGGGGSFAGSRLAPAGEPAGCWLLLGGAMRSRLGAQRAEFLYRGGTGRLWAVHRRLADPGGLEHDASSAWR